MTIEVLHGGHIAWQDNENYLHLKEHLFPWEKESIVPTMQHGCRAKPLFGKCHEVAPGGVVEGRGRSWN